MEGGALSDAEFAQLAKEVVLFLHITSKVEGEPYPKLPKEKGVRIPSVWFMDADGNVLTRGGRSVKAFVETHTQTKKLLALRAKCGDRNEADAKELFLLELRFDLIPAAEIKARSDRIPALSAEEKNLVASKLVDVEVRAVFDKGRELGPDKLGAALAEFAKSGPGPSDSLSGGFWPLVLQHASKQKDAALAQKAYDALMKRYAKDTGVHIEGAKQAWQKLLEEAKAK